MATSPGTQVRARLDRARRAAADAGVDAVLVTPGADLRYLCGYNARPLERLTCLVVPRAGEPVVVVPQLERAAALAAGLGGDGGAAISVRTHGETDDAFELVGRLLHDCIGAAPTTVAVSDRMWAAHALELRRGIGVADVALAGPLLRGLRMRKDDAEIEELRLAGAAIDRVHSRVPEWLRPGRTETEVGRDIAEAIIAEGHASVDFVIVGSGPNSASPHHELSERVIEPGDPVVIDIGGTTTNGYCSDCTRTYVAGTAGSAADADFAARYAVLQHAQQAACSAVRPGITGAELDAVARDVIAAAGYGELFIHRTGHGIGLETHEDPYIVSSNTEPLEPGMAFSIEPGIYVDGRSGARIEDIVVCTDDGGERLNVIDRDLLVVGD
ncbi:MAG: M24 family metallopeptidase [Mycobacteriales bacterium]|nr:MAG: peptidase M24 family protein [Pseudonocardiales bacterium]